jgi:hypothetical protein
MRRRQPTETRTIGSTGSVRLKSFTSLTYRLQRVESAKMPKQPQCELRLFHRLDRIPTVQTLSAVAGPNFECWITVSQSPVGETDGRSIVFSDGGSILHLERVVIVTKNDGDDVRE